MGRGAAGAPPVRRAAQRQRRALPPRAPRAVRRARGGPVRPRGGAGPAAVLQRPRAGRRAVAVPGRGRGRRPRQRHAPRLHRPRAAGAARAHHRGPAGVGVPLGPRGGYVPRDAGGVPCRGGEGSGLHCGAVWSCEAQALLFAVHCVGRFTTEHTGGKGLTTVDSRPTAVGGGTVAAGVDRRQLALGPLTSESRRGTGCDAEEGTRKAWGGISGPTAVD